MTDQNIYPLKGYGDISFGMTANEVKEILGKEQTYEDWMGGNLNGCLLYPSLVIDMKGYPFKLNKRVYYFIFSEHDKAKIFGKRFKDWTLDSFKKYLKEEKISYAQRNNSDLKIESLKLDLGFNDESPFELVDVEMVND